MQTLSTVLARSWLKGQEFPAWQAPCRKNLHGTCDVSIQTIVSVEGWTADYLELTLLSWRASRTIKSRHGSHMWLWAIRRPVQSARRNIQRSCAHVSKFLVAWHSVRRTGAAQHCAVYECRDRGAEVGVRMSRVSCACLSDVGGVSQGDIDAYRGEIQIKFERLIKPRASGL